jgi:hypothetical protein
MPALANFHYLSTLPFTLHYRDSTQELCALSDKAEERMNHFKEMVEKVSITSHRILLTRLDIPLGWFVYEAAP